MTPDAVLARPPIIARQRSQLETFLVLRRNALELWGEAAYTKEVLPGRFFGREQLMLNAPDAIRHVLVANSDNYERNVSTHRVLRPLLGAGLFLAEGAAWRHQRRTIAPAMAPRMMALLARHVVAAAATTEADLAAAPGWVELLPVLQRLALRIAAQSMFSLESAEFAGTIREKLLAYGLRYAQPGVLDLLLPASLPTPLDRGRAAFRRDWLHFMDRIIDRRERLGRGDGEARDCSTCSPRRATPRPAPASTGRSCATRVSTMIIAVTRPWR